MVVLTEPAGFTLSPAFPVVCCLIISANCVDACCAACIRGGGGGGFLRAGGGGFLRAGVLLPCVNIFQNTS